MKMICIPCSIAAEKNSSEGHLLCINNIKIDARNTWCDCQHKPSGTGLINEATKTEGTVTSGSE